MGRVEIRIQVAEQLPTMRGLDGTSPRELGIPTIQVELVPRAQVGPVGCRLCEQITRAGKVAF